MITSADNPLIKTVKNLKRRKARTELGLFVVEGLRGVREAIQSPATIEVVLYSPELLSAQEVSVLHQELAEKKIPCREVGDRIFLELTETETPQGVLGIVRQLNYPLESVLKYPEALLLVADGIQDPGNLGTMLRTALAAGVKGMIMTKGTTDPYGSKVVRSTMGAICHLPLVLNVEPTLVASGLIQENIRTFVADAQGSLVYHQADLRGPVAIILGNENMGPSPELFSGAEGLRIPLLGPVESLNVAVATGIILYEAVHQRSR
ncbi:MAG: TrmH family RNA methyltransferase [Bacillota bacterium]